MANTWTVYTQKFLPILDDIYKVGSLTSNLDTASPQFIDTKTVRLFTMGLQGLGAYNRDTGYTAGSVTGNWETYTLTQDRSRSFQVDYLDNEEQLGMVMTNMVSQFMRRHVIPELDAYRFAKYATNAGLSANGALSSANKVIDALDTAFAAMADAEVPMDGLVCYMSEAAYKQVKSEVTRELGNENTVSHAVASYDGVPIIRVPSSRFNTAVTLKTGAAGQTDGGFEAATGSYGINFLLLHPNCLIQTVKHEVPRLFSPLENQAANAYRFDYRINHDAFVKTNMASGIYLHRGTTAKA